MPSLILNLLIFWFIGNLLAGRFSQRRRQQTAGETVARTKRRLIRRLRRGLTGPSYEVEDEEIETAISEAPARAAKSVSSPGTELGPQQPKTAAIAAASQENVTSETPTALPQKQPLEKTPALNPNSLLVPSALVQSLILMQVLSEPRCKRAWHVR